VRKLIIVAGLLLTFINATAVAEDYIDLVEHGNDAFKAGKYKEALQFYHSAETDLPESPELEYNMACALSQDGVYEEAVERYTKAMNAQDINFEAGTHYNLGNTHFRMEDYQSAIQSYQNSLELVPENVDAKYNLELARKKLKEQIKPQEKEQEQQQQQQQEQEQEKKEEEQQQEKKQQKQQEQQEQQDQEQEQKPQPDEQKEMSKEDAERILNALKNDEEKIQKQLKREQEQGQGGGKDW